MNPEQLSQELTEVEHLIKEAKQEGRLDDVILLKNEFFEIADYLDKIYTIKDYDSSFVIEDEHFNH